MNRPSAAHADIISVKTGGMGMTQWRLDEKTKRKYEAAERFGLTQRLLESGWAGLSAKEAGRIGGATGRHRRGS